MKANVVIILAVVTVLLLFFSVSKPFSAQSRTRAGLDDLLMGQSKFERINQPPFTHRFAIQITNPSQIDTEFDAWCGYSCPTGTIRRAGFDIVQGGYIGGRSGFVYTGMFRFQCSSAPSEIQLLCPIRYADGSGTSPYVIRFKP